MTDQPEPYRSDAYISNRLDSIFGQYRPVIDQDEPEERGESTDALIARVLGDDALRAIEMHREREAARAIDLHNGQQLRAALEEARAAGVDVGTWESFRDAWERSESLAGQMARMSPEERKQLRSDAFGALEAEWEARAVAQARTEAALGRERLGLPAAEAVGA